MFNTARIRQDFEQAAPRYDAHAQLQMTVLRRLLATLGSITPGAAILDAGCGTGALARLLTENHTCGTGNPNLNIVALDNAHAMCLQASHSGNLPINGDMAQLPFADNHFDLVISSLALQWSTDWQAAVQEWLRVLKPGGTLAFSTFGAGTLYELADSFESIDNHTHISQFVNPDAIAQALPAAMVAVERIDEHYPDLLALFRHLKALGARNKETGARSGLMTPRQFDRLQRFYRENHSVPEGLPVSWNIVYARMQKP